MIDISRCERNAWTLCLWLLVCTVTHADEADLSSQIERGRVVYLESCAACHGTDGEGVESSYENSLVGDDSLGQLAARIATTMPEGEPEECVGQEAEDVAAYVYHSFYSEAAQVRNRPPRIGLARLTAEQLRQSIADLYEQFDSRSNSDNKPGVKAIYFDGSRWKDENKKIERIEPVLEHDFGHESPGEGLKAEEFFIYWEGGVRADVSGRYELVVHSTCSFVMDFGRVGRELIDNHTQSGDKVEFRQSLYLTAGRVYPFKIEFVQRKRKTEQPPAKIKLAWVPPGGVEQTIPNRNLVSEQVQPTFSLQAALPADDRSYGFARGIAINREWDASTTAAALEFAQVVVDELWPAYLRSQRNAPGDERTKMKQFLQQLVQIAFRQPMSDDIVETYITKQLQAEVDNAEAIKRAVLVSLKSPRFLYPQADLQESISQRVATRLALILFDSLPTSKTLLQAIEKDEFQTEEQLRAFVRENISDSRVQAKTRAMLYEWLNLGRFDEISKNSDAYPGFDEALVYDLKSSLDAFLDNVVWGKSGDYRQFFTTDWAYTTGRLAEFYGDDWKSQAQADVPPSGAADAPPVQGLVPSVAAKQGRYGLLTHPYLLSGLAYHDATSPIHRGVFLIRYVLGRTLRPPAEAFSPLSPELHPELTTRQRVDLQTSPESCQVCHAKINGLGFVLENYDAVGRFRDSEKSKVIDSTGNYTDRDGAQCNFANVADLARYLAESDDSHRAFVNRTFQHFVKQPAAAFGADTLDRLTEKFRNSDFNIRELISEIAIQTALQPAWENAEIADSVEKSSLHDRPEDDQNEVEIEP